MGKKMKIVKYYLIYALLVMLLYCTNINAQEFNEMKFTFQSKSQIIEWGKKEFGYYVSDTISFNVENRSFFALFGDYSSGIPRKTIYMFSKGNFGEAEEWRLFCMRVTNTSDVSVVLDQKCKEIVFKANSGKTLMIIPFETLNLDLDKSEH